jgi:hypothetical protein
MGGMGLNFFFCLRDASAGGSDFEDFFKGAIVEFHRHRFLIIDSDEYTKRFIRAGGVKEGKIKVSLPQVYHKMRSLPDQVKVNKYSKNIRC